MRQLSLLLIVARICRPIHKNLRSLSDEREGIVPGFDSLGMTFKSWEQSVLAWESE